MSAFASKEAANRLTAEIGPDASFLRTEKDRLYLSGFEIAGIIATGVIVSFCKGVFEGIKKRIGEYGEKLGEKTVDFVAAKVKALLGQVERIDTKNPEAIPEQLAPIYTEIDQLLQDTALSSILDSSYEELNTEIVAEVKEYLFHVGYPDDIVEERAIYLVRRVRLIIRGV